MTLVVLSLVLLNCECADLFEDISTLRALEVLRVCGCPKLKAMPRGIGALRALKTLEAQDMSRLHQVNKCAYRLKTMRLCT